MNSRLFVSKRASSLFSRAKARTRRTPEKFSWASAEISLKNSWIAVNRLCVAWPMTFVAIAMIGNTASATSVSAGETEYMSTSATMPTNSVFAACMIPGPSSMRTAERSFTARLMRSPTRFFRYQVGGSRRRWSKRSWRISYSMSRDAPIRMRRVRKRAIASPTARRTMRLARRKSLPWVTPAPSSSMARRTMPGIARKRPVDASIERNPAVYTPGRRRK